MLTVLRARGLVVPDAIRERKLAQNEPGTAGESRHRCFGRRGPR